MKSRMARMQILTTIGSSHWPLMRLGSGKSCMAIAAVVELGRSLQAWSRTH